MHIKLVGFYVYSSVSLAVSHLCEKDSLYSPTCCHRYVKSCIWKVCY